MTLAERQAAVDAWIGSRLGSVGAMQASRLAADGRYWQGAWTHDAPPVDGPDAIVDIDDLTQTG